MNLTQTISVLVFGAALMSCGGGSSSGSATAGRSEPLRIDTGGDYTESYYRDYAHHINNTDYREEFDDGSVVDIARGFRSSSGYSYNSGYKAGDFETAPSLGKVSMDVAYVVLGVDGVTRVGSDTSSIYLDGDEYSDSGVLDVTFNFDTGSYSGRNTDLSMKGSIDSGDLRGTVVYEGVGGFMGGVVDAEHTVGAFHGADNDEAFAGAFYGVAQ